MLFTLHSRENPDNALSPITGKEIHLSVRAYCGNCGCLVSHKSMEAVEKAISKYLGCKKCGCQTISVKYTATEDIEVSN